jgi:glycosyltransferase involved in cell wall biosynthesis
VRDGKTGVLVPPSDPETLASVLLALAKEPDRARAMGRCGRRFVVPAMSERVMIEKLHDLYRASLCAKGHHLPPLDLPDPEKGPSTRVAALSRD